jgi:hypothetical protein
MDVVSVLFLWGLLQFQEDNGRIGVHGVGAYNPMYWSDETFIAYIRTCARVLLIELWPCYETTLSTMHVETSFNTIINI